MWNSEKGYLENDKMPVQEWFGNKAYDVVNFGARALFDRFDDGWVPVTIQGDVDGDHDVDVADQRSRGG